MEKCVMFLCCLLVTTADFCQTWPEWFSQTATQKKYLIQQIAALQVYIGYLEKGYSIAQNGLTAIGNIKDGHFSLDKDFFASLHNINPKLRNYAKIADITAMNVHIVGVCKRAYSNAKQNGLLNNNELEYLNAVFEKLNKGCADLTDHLIAIVSLGKLQMSDDERIRRTNGIYAEMREKYVFADSFSGETSIMVLQRSKEQQDVREMHGLYRLRE